VQKFVVGGWFILGPDTNILTLTILLISAPSALFNVFVAIQLRDWSLVRPRRNPAHGPTLTPWRTPRTRAHVAPVHSVESGGVCTNSGARHSHTPHTYQFARHPAPHPQASVAYSTAQPAHPLLFQSA